MIEDLGEVISMGVRQLGQGPSSRNEDEKRGSGNSKKEA